MVGLDDLVDVLELEDSLPLPFLKMLGGVDEAHVIGFFVFLQHQDANRNTDREEEIGRKADDGVDVAVFEQFGAYAALDAATEEHAVGQMAMVPSPLS